jgi:hypothetical protein
MDEITKDIQGYTRSLYIWCISFADDVMLIDKSMIGVDHKLKFGEEL